MHPAHEDVLTPGEEQQSQELLSDFARGDGAALGELFRRESPRLLRRLRARLPQAVSQRLGASDILQLTAADLIEMRDSFQNMGMPAFREMVVKIADRRLSYAVRQEQAQKRTPRKEVHAAVGDDGSQAHPDPAVLGAVESRAPSRIHGESEALLRVQQCIAQLPSQDREVLQLLDYDELSGAEAAERLGISISALQKRHSRAIARLRESLRRG